MYRCRLQSACCSVLEYRKQKRSFGCLELRNLPSQALSYLQYSGISYLSAGFHLSCCSVAKSRPTLCNSMKCYTPGFPVLSDSGPVFNTSVKLSFVIIMFWSSKLIYSFCFLYQSITQVLHTVVLHREKFYQHKALAPF